MSKTSTLAEHAAAISAPMIAGKFTLHPTDTEGELELTLESDAGADMRYLQPEDISSDGKTTVEQWALQSAVRTAIVGVFNTFTVDGATIADVTTAEAGGEPVLHLIESFAHRIARFDR